MLRALNCGSWGSIGIVPPQPRVLLRDRYVIVLCDMHEDALVNFSSIPHLPCLQHSTNFSDNNINFHYPAKSTANVKKSLWHRIGEYGKSRKTPMLTNIAPSMWKSQLLCPGRFKCIFVLVCQKSICTILKQENRVALSQRYVFSYKRPASCLEIILLFHFALAKVHFTVI